jgi:hypothetical protein
MKSHVPQPDYGPSHWDIDFSFDLDLSFSDYLLIGGYILFLAPILLLIDCVNYGYYGLKNLFTAENQPGRPDGARVGMMASIAKLF